METEDSAANDERYEYFGQYLIHEAKRLFEALESEGIDFIADFEDGGGQVVGFTSFGTAAGVEVSVDRARRKDTDRVHIALFGSALPSKPANGEGSEDWFDDEALEALKKRDALIEEHDEVSESLEAIVKEMLETKEVLERRDLTSERRQQLEAGQERHRLEAAALVIRREELRAVLD